jgi:2-polyprenyl-3-methyl-5-hydroxy-6-metoxy-1,4-benzoquinol methylase
MQDDGIPTNDQHVEKVKHFFNMPELYLKNQALIEIRKMILRDLLEGKSPKNILDLGCGNGSISMQFLSSSTQVVMVDLSEKMLSIAKMRVPPQWAANVQFVQTDLASLQLTPRFDLVLCIGVLAHVSSVERCIEQLTSSLVPGGYCVLQITRDDYTVAKFLHFYRSLLNRSGYQLNIMNLSSVISLCQKNGLKYLRSISHAPLLPGMGLLPNFILFEYQKYSMLPIFNWICSEAMVLFQKSSDCP